MIRVDKFRLYPARQQEAALLTLLGRLRYFYNAALQERREGYQRGGFVVDSPAVAESRNTRAQRETSAMAAARSPRVVRRRARPEGKRER